MVVAYPGTFPFIGDVNNYRERGPSGNVIRTPMEKGTIKRRRRFSYAPKLVSAQTEIMTNAQVVLFEEFFITTLLHGTLPFTAPNPRTGDTETYSFMEVYHIMYVDNDKNRIVMDLEQA